MWNWEKNGYLEAEEALKLKLDHSTHPDIQLHAAHIYYVTYNTLLLVTSQISVHNHFASVGTSSILSISRKYFLHFWHGSACS